MKELLDLAPKHISCAPREPLFTFHAPNTPPAFHTSRPRGPTNPRREKGPGFPESFTGEGGGAAQGLPDSYLQTTLLPQSPAQMHNPQNPEASAVPPFNHYFPVSGLVRCRLSWTRSCFPGLHVWQLRCFPIKMWWLRVCCLPKMW